jgi:hypothetical protein
MTICNGIHSDPGYDSQNCKNVETSVLFRDIMSSCEVFNKINLAAVQLSAMVLRLIASKNDLYWRLN